MLIVNRMFVFFAFGLKNKTVKFVNFKLTGELRVFARFVVGLEVFCRFVKK